MSTYHSMLIIGTKLVGATKVTKQLWGMTGPMKMSAKAANSLGHRMSAATSAFNRHSRAAKGLAAHYHRLHTTMLALAAGFVGLATKAVKLSAQFEMTAVGFENLLGSAAASAAIMRDLEEFASTTPFFFQPLADSAKVLVAMGFAADNVVKSLRRIADATAAMGGGQELMDRMVLAIGQMAAKGAIAGEEMRQLAQAGIPGWTMLAEVLGKDVKEVMELAEERAINFQVAIDGLLTKMTEYYGGATEALSQTTYGLFSTLKDTVNFALRDVGNTLVDTLNLHDLMRTGIANIDYYGQIVSDLVRRLAGLPPAFEHTAAAVDTVYTQLLKLWRIIQIVFVARVVWLFVGALAQVLVWLKQIAKAIAWIKALGNPWSAIVGAAAAIGITSVAMWALSDATEEASTHASELADKLSEVGDTTTRAWGDYQTALKNIAREQEELNKPAPEGLTAAEQAERLVKIEEKRVRLARDRVEAESKYAKAVVGSIERAQGFIETFKRTPEAGTNPLLALTGVKDIIGPELSKDFQARWTQMMAELGQSDELKREAARMYTKWLYDPASIDAALADGRLTQATKDKLLGARALVEQIKEAWGQGAAGAPLARQLEEALKQMAGQFALDTQDVKIYLDTVEQLLLELRMEAKNRQEQVQEDAKMSPESLAASEAQIMKQVKAERALAEVRTKYLNEARNAAYEMAGQEDVAEFLNEYDKNLDKLKDKWADLRDAMAARGLGAWVQPFWTIQLEAMGAAAAKVMQDQRAQRLESRKTVQEYIDGKKEELDLAEKVLALGSEDTAEIRAKTALLEAEAEIRQKIADEQVELTESEEKGLRTLLARMQELYLEQEIRKDIVKQQKESTAQEKRRLDAIAKARGDLDDLRLEADPRLTDRALDEAKKMADYQRNLVEQGLDQKDIARFMEEYKDLLDKAWEAKRFREMAKAVADAIAQPFEDLLMNLTSFKDALESILLGIQRALLNTFVTQPLTNALQSFIQSFAGGPAPTTPPTGGPSTPLPSSPVGNALGGVYGVHGRISTFAKGGVFDRPTSFNFGRGHLGVLGEAGPEAIMPLEKGPGGRLGLRGGNYTQVNFNIATPDSDSFRRSQRQISQRARRLIR